jgi:hypothetical protein
MQRPEAARAAPASPTSVDVDNRGVPQAVLVTAPWSTDTEVTPIALLANTWSFCQGFVDPGFQYVWTCRQLSRAHPHPLAAGRSDPAIRSLSPHMVSVLRIGSLHGVERGIRTGLLAVQAPISCDDRPLDPGKVMEHWGKVRGVMQHRCIAATTHETSVQAHRKETRGSRSDNGRSGSGDCSLKPHRALAVRRGEVAHSLKPDPVRSTMPVLQSRRGPMSNCPRRLQCQIRRCCSFAAGPRRPVVARQGGPRPRRVEDAHPASAAND